MTGAPPIAALLLGMMAFTACTTPSERIATREDHLAQAGFAFKPADTPALASMLAALPQHRFLRRQHDGKTFYAYADSTVCGCLYVGDETALFQYKQMAAYDQGARLSALNYQNNTWSWGPWAPGWNGWNPAWGNWDPGMMGPVGW